MVKMLWGSGSLVIHNATPAIKAELCYEHKSLEQSEDYSRDARKITETIDLFAPIENDPTAIVTYQGLIDLVVTICKEQNTPYEIADVRVPFPNARIRLAGGFRCKQFLMFLKLLQANRSGLFRAPTRYGKTTVIANVLKVYPGIKTVLAAPGVNLLNQLIEELRAKVPDREIKGIFTGSRNKTESDDITVVSLDSLDKVDHLGTKLLLIDEPHAAAAPKRVPILNKFSNARRLGFGATTEGRFDGADKIITGLFGPVLVEKTFREAVAEQAICPIKVFIIKVPFTPFKVKKRDHAYRTLLHRNEVYNQLVKYISDHVIPPDWQTLIFIDELKQADLLNLFIVEGQIAAACRMTEKERREMFTRVSQNEVKRVICTDIYATGVTIPEIRCIVNAAGGGGSITSTQKPGRLAEIKPGKQAGYLIDFLFKNTDSGQPQASAWKAVVNDCYSRIETYKKNGYEIVIVDHPQKIELL